MYRCDPVRSAFGDDAAQNYTSVPLRLTLLQLAKAVNIPPMRNITKHCSRERGGGFYNVSDGLLQTISKFEISIMSRVRRL